MNNSEKIKALRKELKLTQAELAELVGVKQSSVFYWESGTKKPKLEQVIKLAEVFAVPLSYFGYSTITLSDGTTDTIFIGDDKELFTQNKSLSALLKYLDSLGYEFIEGNLHGAPHDVVGMIKAKDSNKKIPFSLVEFENLNDTIEKSIEFELFQLMKKKNI